MKAERKEIPKFEPVILTLETQHEVDAIFAVLNSTPISLALELPDDAWSKLQRYRNDANAQRLNDALREKFYP